jgi:hypothetical protein
LAAVECRVKVDSRRGGRRPNGGDESIRGGLRRKGSRRHGEWEVMGGWIVAWTVRSSGGDGDGGFTSRETDSNTYNAENVG